MDAVYYALTMWESRQRYGVLFLSLTLMIGAVMVGRKRVFMHMKGLDRRWPPAPASCSPWPVRLSVDRVPSLVWERAGFINQWDMVVSIVFIYVLIQITWSTSGPIIPTVT